MPIGQFDPSKRLHPADLDALRRGLASEHNIGQPGSQRMGSEFAGHHGDRQRMGGYGRLPASTTISQAVAGAFTSTFTFQQDVTDAMLYLNDDAGAVQDITALIIGNKTLTLSGALPASTMRDDASLGGPVKGYYVGHVKSTQVVQIQGNTKLANAIFGFYFVGQYEGDGVDLVGFANARAPFPSAFSPGK